MADKNMIVTVSPHLHERGQTINRAMRDVIIALCPVVLWAIIVFGFNVVYIIAASIITAMLTEVVMRKILGRKATLKDLSAVLTGLFLALLVPPTTPLWVVAIGSFIAVGVAKELFGGLGKNIFNPALFGRVALMISPLYLYVSKYAKPFFWKSAGFFTPVATSINNSVYGRVQYKGISGNVITKISATAVSGANSVTGATPLSLLKSGRMLANTVTGPTPVAATWITPKGRPSFWSLFLGLKGGCIGEVSVLLLLVGGCYLIYRRTIDWRIPVGIIGTLLFIMLVTWTHPIYQLFGGGLFLGAFFMATDWVTSPMTRRGKWVYAVGIGLFIALIRLFSPWPEGVAIAILQWNILTLVLDRYMARPVFGEVKRRWFNKLPSLPGPALEPVKKEA